MADSKINIKIERIIDAVLAASYCSTECVSAIITKFQNERTMNASASTSLLHLFSELVVFFENLFWGESFLKIGLFLY